MFRIQLIVGVAAATLSLGISCSESPQSTQKAPPPDLTPNAAPQPILKAIPGFDDSAYLGQLKGLVAKEDPTADQAWSTEAFSAETAEQLKELAKLLAAPDDITSESLEPFATSEISSTRFEREHLKSVFESEQAVVLRWSDQEQNDSGPAALAKTLNSLRAPLILSSGLPPKIRFKIAGVNGTATTPQARIRYHAASAANLTEQTGEFSSTWAKGKLSTLSLLTLEEVKEGNDGKIHFSDRTTRAFGNDPAATQFSISAERWRDHLQADFEAGVNGLQGIAIGDANGDGLEDLYISQPGGLPNRLFLRKLDGTVEEASEDSGVDWMEPTRAALFVDLDNDGDQDLALAQNWHLMLMENDGRGRFSKTLELPSAANLRSLAAADYDNDGDLDLYFCGRNPARDRDNGAGVLGMPIPYHDANNGGPNILLRNDGNWSFSEATKKVGLDQNNRRYSYAASWEDYDNDGDLDLYVANDFGRNNLYQNTSGQFTDVAGEAGVEDISAGMGVTWGDYNRDGRMDAYVSNMYSNAGNRVTYQRNFRMGAAADLSDFRRHARGNSLFANNGSKFTDVSVASGTTMGRWAWGAKFADINNDGWEDLYVGNGFISTDDTRDL